MIKTLLWDVDGTLLNFDKSENYALKKCFEIFNIGECTDEMVARYSPINKKYWEALERGEITKPLVLVKRFEDFFRSENIDFNRFEEFNKEYQVRLGDRAFLYDDALSTLVFLKGKVKQYAVTNGTFIAQSRKLELSGLNSVFDRVFISDVVGYEKPSVPFFDKVQQETEVFVKDEVMIIGDSLTSDMKGGNNAGILCCWFNPSGTENTKNVKTDFEIQSLCQVIDIVENIK